MSNENDAIQWVTIQAAIDAWVLGSSGLDADHVFWTFEGKPRPSAPYIEMTVQRLRPLSHDWETREVNTLVFAPLAVSAVTPLADTLTITAHGLNTGDGPVHVASTGTVPGGLVALTDYWVIKVDVNTIKLAASYVATGGQQPLGAGNPQTPIDITSAGTGTITVVSTADTLPAGREIKRLAQGLRELTVHLECFAVEGAGTDAMRILSNVMSSMQLYVHDLDLAGAGVSDLGQASPQGGVQHLEGRRGSILEPRTMADVTFYLASELVGYGTIIESMSGLTELDNPAGDPLASIPFSIRVES